MGIRKKKGQSGITTQYMSRAQAIRLLQISLLDFRRLCILKGIYPREPEKRIKAQKGDCTIKTLFLKSDIRFLMHEPMIWKLREEKIRKRKMKLYKEKKEKEKLVYLRNHKPVIDIDHMVLERYPKFRYALENLDDALTSCFLYAALHSSGKAEADVIDTCRRLTVEFMAYVIEAKALRKVFVTFKGYYYRANIMGIDITWVVPHPFPIEVPNMVEYATMKYSLEFYSTLLRFVNFKLFQSLNLYYPIRLDSRVDGIRPSKANPEKKFDLFSSLNAPLVRSGPKPDDDDDKVEEFDAELLKGAGMKLADVQRKQILTSFQKKLFVGCKFFLGRETNRESLIFVIRSAGGEVSWDSTLGPGATYDENDDDITHQVVDRPALTKNSLRRYYVQPQWVYDSFNFAVKMPVQEYFVGAELPPHLSPFEETYNPAYIPPEMLKIINLQRKAYFKDSVGEVEDHPSSESSENEAEEFVPYKKRKQKRVRKKKTLTLPKEPENEPPAKAAGTDDEDALDQETEGTTDPESKAEGAQEENALAKMKVSRGKVVQKSMAQEKQKVQKDQSTTARKLIHRTQKRLYYRLLEKEKRAKKQTEGLLKKRQMYERAVKRKQKLAQKPSSAVA